MHRGRSDPQPSDWRMITAERKRTGLPAWLFSVPYSAECIATYPLAPNAKRLISYAHHNAMPPLFCLYSKAQLGETGVSWAGFCLKSHNSGMLEHITVCLLSLDSQFLYYSNIDTSKLSVSFLVLRPIKASNVRCPNLPHYGVSWASTQGKLGESIKLNL